MNKFINKRLIQKMFKISPFFLLLIVACATPKTVVLKTSFHTLYKSDNGGSKLPGHLHINNNEDFIKLIENLKIDESEFNSLTAVDFNENDIIVLNQGQKSTGGYSIDVISVFWKEDLLLIKKTEKLPSKGQMVTMALTSPYCITIIPKAKSIKIIE